MNNFFTVEGQLKVILAKGLISTYEINELKEQDKIIFTDREGGTACSILYNNTLVGYGEVVITGKDFAVRIIKINNWSPTQLKKRTLIDDNEILFSELVLGERQIKYDHIQKLTVGSIIPINTINHFDRETPTIGQLFVTGFKIAEGNIAIANESWILEITKINFCKNKDLPLRYSTFEKVKNYKYYDFSRPDCVTPKNLIGFKTIHDFFSCYIEGSLKNIEQMMWRDIKSKYKDNKLIEITKQKKNIKESVDGKIYYLSLNDKKTEDDIEMNEYCKRFVLENKQNQIMEKIAVLSESEKLIKLFHDNFDKYKTLLETSWRDKLDVNFGDNINIIKVNESNLLDDFELMIVITIETGEGELIVSYPLTYFKDLLPEIK